MHASYPVNYIILDFNDILYYNDFILMVEVKYVWEGSFNPKK